jgi:hypothetical protein
VLAVLDDKSLEATKRAAMLTTALQWLFNKLPLAIVPPQLKPGVMLAKRFVPYVGYIGAAIAWSWSSVKGYDKGVTRSHFSFRSLLTAILRPRRCDVRHLDPPSRCPS